MCRQSDPCPTCQLPGPWTETGPFVHVRKLPAPSLMAGVQEILRYLINKDIFQSSFTQRSNSQILVTWNFSTNHDIFPWFGEKLHIGAEFQQFSRNNMYVRVPGKLSEIHFKVLVFSNPGDNIRFLVKLQDRFVPLFLHILGPCLLDWRTLGLWNVFLRVVQAPWNTCYSWKTLGTPLQCVVLLQSRGQCYD